MPDPEQPAEERLQRILARAGFGSRRAVEDLIRAGRVTVNGAVATLGRRAVAARDRVAVDGVPVPSHPNLRRYKLNKPPGVTTTLRDQHAVRSVASLLPPGPRVFPVGRLDRDSEGLLLLTNDGDLAQRLLHPRFGVEKEYLVEVEGSIGREALRKLERGVELEDGPARALRVGSVQRQRGRSSLRMVMGEGRKREVRRMLEAVGFPVRRLVRVRIGPVWVGDLKPGKVRPLTSTETAGLYRAVALDRASPWWRRSSDVVGPEAELQ
jgi:23S rRNA pseudouridine2605 synthase